MRILAVKNGEYCECTVMMWQLEFDDDGLKYGLYKGFGKFKVFMKLRDMKSLFELVKVKSWIVMS